MENASKALLMSASVLIRSINICYICISNDICYKRIRQGK